MKTLRIRIETLDEVRSAVVAAAASGRGEADAGLSFASYDLMHRVLSPKRLEIVRSMNAQGPLSIREVARRVGRDFKGVHTDVTALLAAGIIDRDAAGVVFPYDAIRVEFDIAAAAA
jgi:predicted transcriptional regulator